MRKRHLRCEMVESSEESARGGSSFPSQVVDRDSLAGSDASVGVGSENELYFASSEFPEHLRGGLCDNSFSALDRRDVGF